jgi:hypothetical protein
MMFWGRLFRRQITRTLFTANIFLLFMSKPKHSELRQLTVNDGYDSISSQTHRSKNEQCSFLYRSIAGPSQPRTRIAVASGATKGGLEGA